MIKPILIVALAVSLAGCTHLDAGHPTASLVSLKASGRPSLPPGVQEGSVCTYPAPGIISCVGPYLPPQSGVSP